MPLNPLAERAQQLQHQQLQQLQALQAGMPAHMQQQLSADLGVYDPSSPLLVASSQTQQLQAQARTAPSIPAMCSHTVGGL